MRLARRPATTTIYVALPPPGHITTSCAIPSRSSGRATAACSPRGRRGSTGSSRSPTSRPPRTAIAAGETPPIRSRADSDAAATLARLDVRLTRAHDARTGATLVLVGWLVAFASLGILARSVARGPCRRARRAGRARHGARPPRGRRRRPVDGRHRDPRGRHGRWLAAPRPPAGAARPCRRAVSSSRSSSSSRPGRRSTRWRRSGRIPTAAEGSSASRTRSRRSCSRRHSLLRRRPASSVPWRSGCCSSSSSAGVAPAPTEEACSSSRRHSRCCSRGSPASG